MIIRKGDIIELWVDKTAYGGQGIARFDGLAIFIKGAVPGDRILAQVIKKKKSYADARLLEIIDPSADRIAPPCPYSGYCGGCQWQFLKYEKQLEYKRDHVRDSLMRLGGLPETMIHQVIPSEKTFGYRNKMEFSFSDRRWLLPDEFQKDQSVPDFGLGLHVPGTFNKVIDVEACLLQNDNGNKILREVRRYVKESGVPVYGLKTQIGFWRFLTLRHSAASDEWMVNLVTSEENNRVMEPLAEILSKNPDNIKTVVHNINSRKAAIAVGEREIVLAGDGYIEDRIGPFNFQISANSFFQTNTRGAEILYEKVVEYAGLTGTETVLDLYCGTGTIPIFLSGQAKEVVGMEIVESAILDAEKNCKENNISNCRFVLGDIKEKLKTIKIKPDVLIIDPPRAGMHKDVLAGVLELATETIVYVSCNPTTMARDMGQMHNDYEVIEVQPVDMFPHTYHIESVAKFVRRKKA